jgi:hypothetical protein
MIHITHTVRNDNPNTIYNRLAARLGREPSEDEARDEVRAILNDEKPGPAEARPGAVARAVIGLPSSAR